MTITRMSLLPQNKFFFMLNTKRAKNTKQTQKNPILSNYHSFQAISNSSIPGRGF